MSIRIARFTNASNLRQLLRPVIAAVCVLVVASLSACTTETHSTGNSEIRLAEANEMYRDVALYEVFHNGKSVGTARRKLIIDGDSDDGNDRFQLFVYGLENAPIGYINDRQEAFRFQAHTKPELVASSPKLSHNVRAIYGWHQGEISLKKMYTTFK